MVASHLADHNGLIAVDTTLCSTRTPCNLTVLHPHIQGLYTIDMQNADATRLIAHTASFAAEAVNRPIIYSSYTSQLALLLHASNDRQHGRRA